VSSIIHVLVPDQWFRKLIPKNVWLGLLAASLLGIVFPICECGMIPIVRRLLAKGMPLYAGVVFILVGPIVNPIVFSATWTAFRTRPEMVYSRMGLAVAVGIVIGLLIHWFVKQNPLRNHTLMNTNNGFVILQHHHHHNRNRIREMLKHTGDEVFDMGKYLILGSLITACIQAFIPRSHIVDIGHGDISSHFYMMGFAFLISLCSTSDAFVASSFVNTFSLGSLLTFLVFGPMLDIKSGLMMLSLFKTRFVVVLAIMIAAFVFIGSWIISHTIFN
jgi:uncharacterized membrane protein YraQ (UPF0718 family)